MVYLFAATIFLSALLLFWIQLTIAKMLLPRLGGTPAVWNTCMLFFQILLLAGYSYVLVTTSWLDARKRPVFVELPLAQYRQLQGAWNLPAIATQEQAR